MISLLPSAFTALFAVGSSSDRFFMVDSSACQGRTLTATALYGGYDATVQNPHLPIQFYTLPGGLCPYAARTHIVLLELGVPFDAIEVPRGSDWYLTINPRGKVPALRVGTMVIYESAICNEYLCDSSSENENEETKTLMPKDPVTRAKIRLLNDHYDTVVGPAQFTFLMNKEDADRSKLLDTLEKSLDVYEEALAAGHYLMGDTFTLADAHFVPFFYRLVVSLDHYQGYQVDRNRFPRLLEWHEACSQRESVVAATPSRERIIEVYKVFVENDYAFGGLNKNKK